VSSATAHRATWATNQKAEHPIDHPRRHRTGASILVSEAAHDRLLTCLHTVLVSIPRPLQLPGIDTISTRDDELHPGNLSAPQLQTTTDELNRGLATTTYTLRAMAERER
jgi:hypothetical protein